MHAPACSSYAHTHTRVRAQSHTHMHTLSHTHMLTHTCICSRTLMHSQSHWLSHEHTLTHYLSHTRTHPGSYLVVPPSASPSVGQLRHHHVLTELLFPSKNFSPGLTIPDKLREPLSSYSSHRRPQFPAVPHPLHEQDSVPSYLLTMS